MNAHSVVVGFCKKCDKMSVVDHVSGKLETCPKCKGKFAAQTKELLDIEYYTD
jgi:uncharacterized CHY-type Zn-finger protein